MYSSDTEELERLIGTSQPLDYDNESDEPSSGHPSSPPPAPTSTLIPVTQVKGYGSLTTISTGASITQRLTYTWSDIDVFGEVPQDFSVLTALSNRVRNCFSSGQQKIPVPRKHLLKSVMGVAHSGELLAVMGSSGAGKTTLLNALAFRSPPGVKISQTAVRALNGIPVGADDLRARCAYIQQDDLFIGSLTCREHLVFQAMLRMDRCLSYKQKMRRVDEVIAELSLGQCKNTLIGNPGRVKGLSGGERKRLAFASEALTDPAMLLCDEPTSGLDSFMAHSVLQVLKRLALKGKTIIVTIHQPSSELFGLFDKLLLVAEGRVAFLGTPLEATDFFEVMNAPCPTNYNPADFYVQMLAVVPGREAESRDTIRKICDSYAISGMAKTVQKFVSSERSDAVKCLEAVKGTGSQGYRATWCTQFRAILWRSWITVLKEPMLVKVRLIQTFMIAILIGMIFYGQELNQDGVMNMNGAMFLFLTNMTFQNVFSVINVFCTELPVFLRESHSRLYSTNAYFLGKTLAELPLFVLIPIIFTSITYPMIGLQWSWMSFLTALALITLVANVSTSFGYLISCMTSSISMALSVGPPIIIPFLLFGGYFLNSGSVPVYFKWLSYLSWFRYGNEGLLINQWASVGPGEIECTRLNATCPSSGHVILETLSFSEENLAFDFFGLWMLMIVFRVIAYLALMLRARSKE